MSRAEYMRRWRAAHPGRQYHNWKGSRLRHPAMRAGQRNRNYAKGAAHLTLAERAARRPWTAKDDATICAKAVPDRVLAVRLRRTVRAIQARRARLRRAA